MQSTRAPTRIHGAPVQTARVRLASATTALVLGLIVLVLVGATIPLSVLAHRYSLSNVVLTATSLVFAVVSVVVARY
jgi:putative exporter of polyketide antibiotics